VTNWRFGPSNSALQIRTAVAGPAAKMGHRLTLSMASWQATVTWAGGEPSVLDLAADVSSLEVLTGEGGVTPLSGPEKAIIRTNALKSLEVQRFPEINFQTSDIAKSSDGYRLAGQLTIHGVTKHLEVALHVEDRGDTWQMSANADVRQSDFHVRPYSLMMGTLKVADTVTVSVSATHAKDGTLDPA
jgi:polyisoprenoid-binding protein YceI